MLTKTAAGKLFLDEDKNHLVSEGTVIIEYESTKGFPIKQTTLIMEGDWSKLGDTPDTPYALELDGEILGSVSIEWGCMDGLQSWFHVTFLPKDKIWKSPKWYKILADNP